MTWSVAGTDAARFSISTLGELTFKSPPDYEAPNDANADNVYEVTVRASDGSLTSTLDVSVTVTDMNESGVVTGPTSVDYAENGTAAVATYSATDPDGDSVTWSVAGTDAARFSISAVGALSEPPRTMRNDANADNVYEVTIGQRWRPPDYEAVRTMPTGGQRPYEVTPPLSCAMLMTAGTDAARFSISPHSGLCDEVDNVTAPLTRTERESTARASPAHRPSNYAENGTTIVAAYSATDPDGDGVTWSVAGTDAARFSISDGRGADIPIAAGL